MLPGSVGADERPDGVELPGAAGLVAGQQVAEHGVDQGLRLGLGARPEQGSAVTVTSDGQVVGLGDANLA